MPRGLASAPLTKSEFESLSEFRYQVRRFERMSENAVRARGVTPLQYLLLLHVQGYPGRDHASVGELAERLQAQPHGVVALVSRCEEGGFVARHADPGDRRRVFVRLTPRGAALLADLAAVHRTELRGLRSVFPVTGINDRA